MSFQLIILMALAKGKSRVQVGPISLHTQTAIHIAETLTKVGFRFFCFSGMNLHKLFFKICKNLNFLAIVANNILWGWYIHMIDEIDWYVCKNRLSYNIILNDGIRNVSGEVQNWADYGGLEYHRVWGHWMEKYSDLRTEGIFLYLC